MIITNREKHEITRWVEMVLSPEELRVVSIVMDDYDQHVLTGDEKEICKLVADQMESALQKIRQSELDQADAEFEAP